MSGKREDDLTALVTDEHLGSIQSNYKSELVNCKFHKFINLNFKIHISNQNYVTDTRSCFKLHFPNFNLNFLHNCKNQDLVTKLSSIKMHCNEIDIIDSLIYRMNEFRHRFE